MVSTTVAITVGTVSLIVIGGNASCRIGGPGIRRCFRALVGVSTYCHSSVGTIFIYPATIRELIFLIGRADLNNQTVNRVSHPGLNVFFVFPFRSASEDEKW